MKSSNKPRKTDKKPSSERLVALDVFRGMTVALMILVNNPGSWAHIYPPLRHAAWHGLTPTDLVFPFFLFIVGVAISLGFARRLEQGAVRSDLLQKIVSRSAVIFLLGLFLNGFPFGLFGGQGFGESLAALRFMGVLQRIALCYLLVAVTVVFCRRTVLRLAVGVLFLLVYELLLRMPWVDGWGAGSFDLETNFVRLVDLKVFGESHLYHVGGVAFDPEGLLSTLPAAFTTLLGFFTGEYLRRQAVWPQRWRALIPAGLLLTALGWLLSLVEPLNKQLWTVSYSVLTGGMALLTLALSIWMVDGLKWRRGVRPWVIFGRNPLVAFLGSGLLARVLGLVRVSNPEGGSISLKGWLFGEVFEPLAGPVNGSLLFALATVGLWMALLWWLDRRDWVIKV